MKRVLIYKDNEAIEQSKVALRALVTHFQSLYEAFKAINIELTVSEIAELISNKTNIHAKDIDVEREFVREKIVENISEKQWQGVTYLDKAKLKELVSVPDISSIKQILSSVSTNWHGKNIQLCKMSLLEIRDGKVAAVETATNIIEEAFTYYASTEKGDAIAACLHGLCEKLNEFEALALTLGIPGSDLSKGFPYIEVRKEYDYSGWLEKTKNKVMELFGIQKSSSVQDKKQGRCYPSLAFIRTWEKI